MAARNSRGIALRPVAGGAVWRARGPGSWLLLAPLFVSSQAEARLNLPQSREVVSLPQNTAETLAAYFGGQNAEAELPASIEQQLLASLPQDFSGACADIVGHWGEIAKHTSEWHVRILFPQPKSVWLAFRCSSRAPVYVRHYDERLAVLRLDTGRLQFLPLGPNVENDSDLYHLEFAGTLPLEGATGLVFRVATSNDNPCCDGPEAIAEESLRAFADSPQGPRQVLSVVTRREHDSHNDVEGDTETVYQAEVKFERDAQVRVNGVVATFREVVNGFTWKNGVSEPHRLSERTGTLRFRWNPASLRFEPVK
jgi:hypothetical protein